MPSFSIPKIPLPKLPSPIGELDRLSPKDFSTILDDIEFQKGYLFRITLPEIKTEIGTLRPKSNMFDFCTSSTAIPSLSTAVQTINYYNSELKIATKTTYPNWNAAFRMDTNKKTVERVEDGASFNTWEYFYCWQSMANQPTSRTSALPSKYKKIVDLFLLNENADINTFSSSYMLEGIYPVGITGGNLDYSADSILTFSVEFAYDRVII